ncbi:rod shape-determining protein MreC [Caloranaerobacter azorensis DSM 13643]|uniref:Cell shape-determining protein MreC n=1 Tax=Caloranaerobacter azorensis DSM 13643 TaxID=1121264 RepID=A0A1M5UD65_9FIRM|nr:rod shape-determining protein MreC [Caloranaerobacter azorensis]SHH60861.1 rod shape-determining protein MreC [Caloranaerobacter azorensis DSM 13643]
MKKYRGRMIVALVAIILLIIIGLTSKNRQSITSIENIAGKIVTPVQGLFYTVDQKITNAIKSVTNVFKLKAENEKMKAEILKLKAENRKMEDIISRAEYLKNEAIMLEKSKYNFIKAKIIGKDPGNWFDRFIINKGSRDGIKEGSIIIKAVKLDEDIIEEGLVGKVIEVGDSWSEVLAIVDEGSKVSFKVIRTQDGGILNGSITGEMSGYLFDSNADIVEGDKLITSGLGEVFVEGLYIGKIKKVIKKGNDLVKRILVEPAINFKKLDYVYVITGVKEYK